MQATACSLCLWHRLQTRKQAKPCEDDLWNMGIAKKHLGQYEEALPMLLKAMLDNAAMPLVSIALALDAGA